MAKSRGRTPVNNKRDCIVACHSTQQFGSRTLLAAMLGVVFASVAAPVGAETTGQESSRFSVLKNGASTLVGWGQTGVQHVWSNVPTRENFIPYVKGAVAGGVTFAAKRMAVQSLADRANSQSYGRRAASFVVSPVVDSVVNTVLSYGEASEAFQEGFALGQSATAAVYLASDLYAAAASIKQHFENRPPSVDAGADRSAAEQLLAAERHRDQAREDLTRAQRLVNQANQDFPPGSMARAQGRMALATSVLDTAEERVRVAETFVRERIQINLDAAWSGRPDMVSTFSTLVTDVHGIARTETGAAVLSSIVGIAVGVPVDEWKGIGGGGGNVEGGEDAAEDAGTTTPGGSAVPSNRGQEKSDVTSGDGPVSILPEQRRGDADLVGRAPDPVPEPKDPTAAEKMEDDHDQGTEEQQLEEQQVEEQQQAEAKRVAEQATGDEQSEAPQAHAAEVLEQLDAPVMTLEASPPARQAAIRPAAGAYNSNAWAANTMFQMNLGDRLNSYYEGESSSHKGSAWIRYSGSSIRQKDDSGELYTKGDKNAVMMGVDMFMPSSNGRDQFTVGVMGGYGHYTGRTHSDSFNYSSVGKVDGYSMGLYGTYQQDVSARQGLYADSWLLWNRFNNTVNGGELPREKYDSKGVTASMELGYSLKLSERNNVKYVVQPHAQAIYQNVRAQDFREADGTRVDLRNGSRLQTAVGVRAAAHIPTGLTSIVIPHLEVNWLHSTKGYGVRLDDAGSEMNSGRNAGQLKLGLQGEVNRNVSLNIELFHNQGNGGYRETGGNLAAKYRY